MVSKSQRIAKAIGRGGGIVGVGRRSSAGFEGNVTIVTRQQQSFPDLLTFFWHPKRRGTCETNRAIQLARCGPAFAGFSYHRGYALDTRSGTEAVVLGSNHHSGHMRNLEPAKSERARHRPERIVRRVFGGTNRGGRQFGHPDRSLVDGYAEDSVWRSAGLLARDLLRSLGPGTAVHPELVLLPAIRDPGRRQHEGIAGHGSPILTSTHSQPNPGSGNISGRIVFRFHVQAIPQHLPPGARTRNAWSDASHQHPGPLVTAHACRPWVPSIPRPRVKRGSSLRE